MSRISRVAVALSAALIVTIAPVAYGQTDFNNDGDIIGVVAGDARVGFAPVNPPITVTANAGTSVGGDLYIYNDTALDFTGGSVGNFLFARDSSIVNLTGGSVTLALTALGNSRITVTGGDIGGNIGVYESGLVNLRGGSVGGLFSVEDTGILNIFGSALNAALEDPDAGGFSQYTLSGFLEDGTDITGKELFVSNNGAASFALNPTAAAPEPNTGAFVLFAAGLVAGVVARRRRK